MYTTEVVYPSNFYRGYSYSGAITLKRVLYYWPQVYSKFKVYVHLRLQHLKITSYIVCGVYYKCFTVERYAANWILIVKATVITIVTRL
jgi:hypothetical protein